MSTEWHIHDSIYEPVKFVVSFTRAVEHVSISLHPHRLITGLFISVCLSACYSCIHERSNGNIEHNTMYNGSLSNYCITVIRLLFQFACLVSWVCVCQNQIIAAVGLNLDSHWYYILIIVSEAHHISFWKVIKCTTGGINHTYDFNENFDNNECVSISMSVSVTQFVWIAWSEREIIWGL
jgi:hypothetical protein